MKSNIEIPDFIHSALEKKGISKWTDIQNAVIEKVFNGEDMLFQSETGTGKTFAYLVPVISQAMNWADCKKPQILIVCPTVELSSQVKRQADLLCESCEKIKSALITGSANIQRQIESLKKKPFIVVGTLARLLDLSELGKLKLDEIKAAVFDEIDRIVSKEMLEDAKRLFKKLPKDAQILGCSATLGDLSQFKQAFPQKKFSFEIVKDDGVLSERITHIAIYAEQREKIDITRSILRSLQKRAIVFTSRPDQVENIFSKLKYKKINCCPLYSKMEKKERKSSLDSFLSGKTDVLVTSDLAARGLDFHDVEAIIQTDIQEDENAFLHRAGRTGRAKKNGLNIVVGNERDLRNLEKIEKKLKIIVHPKMIYGGKLSDIEKA